MKKQLNIQIWSDVACPFCYIGKRKLESALNQFEHKDDVTIEWKSYQLNPDADFPEGANTTDYLANKYGRDRAWAESMQENVTNIAKGEGLEYHLGKAILADTFNAHRLSHLAKKHNVGDQFEELLFKAYFTKGLNVNDRDTLIRLAGEAGISKDEAELVLDSDAFADDVKQDAAEAQTIGVQGVPFFVLDNKYAVSGAQHSETFLNALQKAWEEGDFDADTIDPNSCSIDGCD